MVLDIIDEIVKIIKPEIKFVKSKNGLFQLAFDAAKIAFDIKKNK